MTYQFPLLLPEGPHVNVLPKGYRDQEPLASRIQPSQSLGSDGAHNIYSINWPRFLKVQVSEIQMELGHSTCFAAGQLTPPSRRSK